MSIVSQVAEKAEVSRKETKAVYEALCSAVRIGLKHDRKVRLPGIGIVAVKFKAARPKRKGINPFTKKPAVFKAKPASNKLKFRPAKELKLFVAKLPVVPVKGKKKKKKR